MARFKRSASHLARTFVYNTVRYTESVPLPFQYLSSLSSGLSHPVCKLLYHLLLFRKKCSTFTHRHTLLRRRYQIRTLLHPNFVYRAAPLHHSVRRPGKKTFEIITLYVCLTFTSLAFQPTLLSYGKKVGL